MCVGVWRVAVLACAGAAAAVSRSGEAGERRLSRWRPRPQRGVRQRMRGAEAPDRRLPGAARRHDRPLQACLGLQRAAEACRDDAAEGGDEAQRREDLEYRPPAGPPAAAGPLRLRLRVRLAAERRQRADGAGAAGGRRRAGLPPVPVNRLAVVVRRDAGGRGSGCGYATAPAETVNYVSAHDNETLWDLVALKLPPDAGAAARARVVLLAQALLAWSQGIPFFHAGDELLRSKSLDRDSYNSGDHFNALDWSGARTGWGVGLPPAPKNRHAWHMMAPLLADPKGAPSREQALAASALFRELLAVRASSPLFRLRSEAEVQARLRLHNRGPSELPGLLVWELRDEELGPARDPRFQRLLMLLNATTEQQSLAIPDIGHLAWRLHPSLRSDATTALATCRDGAVSMPPLTAACFVVERF